MNRTAEQIAALKVEQDSDLLMQLKATAWTIKTSARSKFLMRAAAERIEELEARLKQYEDGMVLIGRWIETGEIPR